MSKDLLPYYDRELAALRQLASDFAEAHPKAAGRLRIGQDAVDDPHVGRLLEGAAFLAGRVHRRLDDEYPELTDALLGLLYPNYLAPLPAAAIAQFACQPDVRVPIAVPRGTAIETDPIEGEPCRFTTTADATLWPIRVEGLRLSGLPLAAPINPQARGAKASLRFILRTLDPGASFADLAVDQLRLHLTGPADRAVALYELLCNHALSLALAEGPNDPNPTLLPPSALRPAGFADEEALYPWSPRSFSGFRLLTEYFAMPEKFLFVDLVGIEARSLIHTSGKLEVFVYLDRTAAELERTLRPEGMALGCVPIINLFPQRCEPIPLTHQQTEYLVAADHRRTRSLEVWSIEQVRELNGDGSTRPWLPFYRHAPHDFQAESSADAQAGFYTLIRRAAPASLGGTQVYLAPMDPALSLDRPADQVLSVDALCSNRDLPSRLPFGEDQPALHLSEGMGAVASLRCLTAPTPSLRQPLHDGRAWKLISHLSLSHLSVVGGTLGAENLRAMLRLYDPYDSEATRSAIAGLVSVSSALGTARVPGAQPAAFCRGLDVTLTCDPRSWSSSGLFLMTSVLERVLALHTTVNSFVRCTVILEGRSGAVARFPSRAGARLLL